MTKDEIKNRISMALKDPILQQGFECICKENAELKELLKEAVQLLKNSDELYGYQIRDFQLKCEQFPKESK
jgi:hypothetical protein